MSGKNGLLRIGVVFPLFLLVVNTIYFAACFSITANFTPAGEMGPQHIPMLVSGLMYVALIVVLTQELRNPMENEGMAGFLRPFLVMVATGAFIGLFPLLGYVIATLLFVAALFVIFEFETKRPLFFALYAVAVTAVFYGLFAGIFGVRLPSLTGGII